MKHRNTSVSAVIATVAMTGMACAQGLGVVKQGCEAEIAKLCADKQHVRGAVRACLEARKSEVSTTCRQALDATNTRPGLAGGKR